MALIGTISGSNGTSNTAVSGTLVIADRAGALFPVIPSDAVLFVSGAIGGGSRAVFGGDALVSGSLTGSNALLTGDLAVNGGDITTTATTFNLLNANATTINFGSAADTVNIGKASTSTTVLAGDVRISGGFIYSSTALAMTIGGSNAAVIGDFGVNGGDITTTASTFNLLNSTATTINFAGGATSTLRIGNSAGTNAISGSTRFPQGLSGSLTKLTDGTDYILAGTNISTSTGSNGAITISVTGITPGMTSLTGDVTGTGPGSTATTISTTGINRTNNLGLTTLTSTAPTATQLRDIPAFRCAGTYTPAYFDLVAPTDSPEGRQVTFVNATGAPLTIRNIGAASVRTMSSFGGSIWVYSTASVNWFCTSNV